MTSISDDRPAIGRNDATTLKMFQQEWRIYRKMVENNFLFHREAYAQLRSILLAEALRPFRFLDIACGDAAASAEALQGTEIAQYYGIDFSRAALDLARNSVKTLGCPFDLHEGDFVDMLSDWVKPVDVAWVGLSLHHLPTSEKLAVMRQVRRIVGGGLFLLYENTSPDGEEREGWMRRWDRQKPLWTAYTPEEWDAMSAHVHAADFPETCSVWHALGREAGFRNVREIFAAPSDLFRMYCFA